MKKQPLKVIAGTPDHPLIIGGNQIPCYVLEDETRVLVQSAMITGLGMALGSAQGGGCDRLFSFVKGRAINLLASGSSP